MTAKILSLFQNVLALEAKSIEKYRAKSRASHEAKTILGVLKLMRTCLEQRGKVIVTGVGKSGKIGQKISATLASTGNLSVFLHPTEGLHGDLGMVEPRDCVLVLSYSGNNEEILKLALSLKSRKTKLIGLGGNAHSKLAALCDFWIDGSVEREACPFGLAPTTSSTLALAIGDALAVALMELRGFDSRQFAKNHPGGALGRRLNLTLEEVMHRGKAVSTVTRDASMEDVIYGLSQKRLGAVLVVQKKKLLGLITEGDLRRALKNKEKFFALKAGDVMTKAPIFATPELSLREALERMENRKHQLNVLPILNHRKEWLGLVRLHDLIQSL